MNLAPARWMGGTLMASALGFGSLTQAAAAAPAPAPVTLYAPVALSQATVARTSFYVNPPASLKTAGGVPLTLANAYWLHYGDPAATLSMNFDKPQAVYLLVNTSWTDAGFAGQTVGTVHLTFSDGTFRDTALVVGANIRDWEYGVSWTANWLSPSSATASVWQGQGQASQGGAAATIDMLTIPAVSTARLTGVSVTDTNNSHMAILFQGLTVLYDPIVVAPKPAGHGTKHENDDEHGDGDSHHGDDEHGDHHDSSHDGHDRQGHD